MDVSSSTVRSELAELETLGLLTHPHTSAGRVPTENGYRLYAEELVDTIDGRPERISLDVATMRNELEAALQSTTETLSQATRLLALVSAPDVRVRLRPPRRRAPAAAARRDRRRDHLHGQRHEARARARGARRPGPRRLGPDVSRGAGDRPPARLEHAAAPARGSRAARRGSAPSSAGCGPRSSTRSRTTGSSCSSAGPPGCSATRAAPSSRRASACSRCSSGAPRCSSCSRTRSTRGGPSSGSARRSTAGSCTTSRTSARRYGLASRSLGSVALLGPLRMDYDKAIRTVRAAAFELSRLVEDVYEDE